MMKTEDYKGFTISWPEPPETGAGWTANVASGDPGLYALLHCRGAEVKVGRTCEEMLAEAKKYIDALLAS